MKKPNYGIDAPGVIRNLFLFSIAGLGMATYLYFRPLDSVSANYSLISFGLWGGGVCFIEALLMLLYAKKGKFRHIPVIQTVGFNAFFRRPFPSDFFIF